VHRVGVVHGEPGAPLGEGNLHRFVHFGFLSMEFSEVRWRDIASGNIYTRDAMHYDITTSAIPESSFSS